MKTMSYIRSVALFAIFCGIPSLSLSQPAEVRLRIEGGCPVYADDINGLDAKVGIGDFLHIVAEARSGAVQDFASLGFRVYDPTSSAAGIKITNLQMSVAWESETYWTLGGGNLSYIETDGALPESWLLSGGTIPSVGGFIETDWVDILSFTVKMTDSGVICIDSAFIPPAGDWQFQPYGPAEFIAGGGDINVGGASPTALCFSMWTVPCLGPQYTICVDSVSTSYCSPVTYHVEADDPNLLETNNDPLYRSMCATAEGVVNYDVEHNGFGTAIVTPSGDVTYTPSIADTNSIVEVVVNAWVNSPCGGTECVTSVYVTYDYPQITCPFNMGVSNYKGRPMRSTTPSVSDNDLCEEHVWSLVSVSPTPTSPMWIDSATGVVWFDSLDISGGFDTDYTICIEANDQAGRRPAVVKRLMLTAQGRSLLKTSHT
jgi:hypothetical protein